MQGVYKMNFYTMKFNDLNESWKVDLINEQHCACKVIQHFNNPNNWYFRQGFIECKTAECLQRYLKAHDYLIEIEEIDFDIKAKPKDKDFEIMEVSDER